MNLVSKPHLVLFLRLLQEDFIIFRANFFDKMINLSIWVACTAAIFGYVMPYFGLAANFGSFQLASLIASAGLFEVWPSAMNLISDMEGDRVIDYQLTLPIPSWVIILKKLCYYALNSIILCICVIPIGKVVLWNQFSLSSIRVIPLLLLIIVSSFFYGGLTLWLSSKVVNMTKIDNIWMRFIFPMWYLGGFEFSWNALYSVWPLVAYLNLLNPMTYVMEGMRAALFGPPGFISVWICIGALSIFTVFCWFAGLKNLKKRLDFV